MAELDFECVALQAAVDAANDRAKASAEFRTGGVVATQIYMREQQRDAARKRVSVSVLIRVKCR